MNAEQLLAHFDRISDAPDAIPRLRRLVVDLGVRGMLGTSDPTDIPANELLISIRAGRSRMAKDRSSNAEMRSTTKDELLPFALPNGWCWTWLGDVIDLLGGQHLKPDEYADDASSGPPYITGPADFSENGLSISRYALVRKAIAKKGQILLTVKGSGVGKTAICDLEEVAISRQLMAVTPIGIHRQFLLHVMRDLADRLKAAARSLIPGISREDIQGFLFALPPLAEQHRIVAKVDELMGLCDRLEAAQEQREACRTRLTAASLARLNRPADAPQFREHVRFHLQHFPRFTTRPDQIPQLRQTILDLAIRGKLLEQESDDDPVDVSIREVLSSADDEFTFLIPATWAWVRVSSVSSSRLGKMLDKGKNKGTPRPYLRNINVRWFDFDLTDLMEMPFEDRELEEYSLRPRDVLICEGGEPGRAAVWGNRGEGVYFQKAIHRVRFTDAVDPYYFVHVLRLWAESGRLSKYFTGTGIKHLTGKGLATFLFPLPPVAEQHRIVAKVEELMALCDQLETQLTVTQTESRRLLEATLHQALAPALEPAV